jgi:hypothetical protein
LAAFVAGCGQGHAQGTELIEIIAEFCEDVSRASIEGVDDLGEATRDLLDCSVEFEDCQTGLFDRDPVSCIAKYARCNTEANEDQTQACDLFERRFEDAYDDALRDARREGPETETLFQIYIVEQGQECLEPAVFTATACSGLSEF